MEDLFRFIMVRPADAAAAQDAVDIAPQGALAGELGKAAQEKAPRAALKAAAAKFAAGHSFVADPAGLKYAAGLQAAGLQLLAGGLKSLEDLLILLEKQFQLAPAALAAREDYLAERARVDNSLVALKLASDGRTADPAGLARLALLYELPLRAAAASPDLDSPAGLSGYLARLIRLPAWLFPAAPAPAAAPQAPPAPAETSAAEKEAARLQAAIAALSQVRGGDFQGAPVRRAAAAPGAPAGPLNPEAVRLAAGLEGRGLDLGAAAGAAPAAGVAGGVEGAARLGTAQLLRQGVVRGLAPQVRQTLQSYNLNLNQQPLPQVMDKLQSNLQLAASKFAIGAIRDKIIHLGDLLLPDDGSNEYAGGPGGFTSLPKTHGSISPVGVADLLVVKQHLVRYEGGELAHIENVLKTESMSRDTRRFERSEQSLLQENERTSEEERDQQSTERFSLQRETSSLLKEDTSLKAGVAVTASYGPMVEVKAYLDYATSSSSEQSTKQASNFSKDVTTRAASKVVEKVRTVRSSTTINEFEEKAHHGFDNTLGAGHVTGVYQWVDKIYESQVYNYGRRLMFDVMVPEPAAFYIYAQRHQKAEGKSLQKPAEFTLRPDQLDETNYLKYALTYNVTGLEAPPKVYQVIAKTFDDKQLADPGPATKTAEVPIPEGYRAIRYEASSSTAYFTNGGGPVLTLHVGNYEADLFNNGYVPGSLDNEEGNLPVSLFAWKILGYTINLEIVLQRTDNKLLDWKMKTHAAITQGYLKMKSDYDNALAAAQAGQTVQISGQNPLTNREIEQAELKKAGITLLTAQQFDGFGAIELSAQGYPQLNFPTSDAQGRYARFFEQAFEWEQMMYFFYPYFWGKKSRWLDRALLNDTDPLFAEFLKAGMARVVFPVRPGFEKAVIHYLETGEIWNGGDPPDINSPMYVSIVKEVQEQQGAPGQEVTQGDPWQVRLPTTLVMLRPDSSLPRWKKDAGGNWVAEN